MEDFLDKLFIVKFIGKKIKYLIESKGKTLSEVSKLSGVAQPDISNILNARRAVSLKALKNVFISLDGTNKEWESLLNEAKRAEYKESSGEDLNIIPDINLNTLEGLDLDNKDLIRVVMKREMGKEPTDEDIQTILSVIKMKRK